MNAKRIIVMLLTTILLLTAGLVLAGAADGEDTAGTTTTTTATTPEPPPVPNWENSPEYRAQVVKTFKSAVHYKSRTHFWSHKRGVHGPRGVHNRLTMSHSLSYETYRLKTWRARASASWKAYKQWQRMWSARNRSMWKAVEAAAREYRVSASWLHACISTEGGHGGWVMNHGGSGAGGWAQFMESTFYGYVDDARTRNRFPRSYRKWTSRVGQAYTMAYMFKIGESDQWTGAGC